MKWTLLFTFLISFSCWSAGQVKIIVSSSEEVKMGDVLTGELVFWPREEVSVTDIKSLEASFLGKNSIYVGLVREIGQSPHNEQALTAQVILVPTAASIWSEIKTITIKGKVYPLQITAVKAQAFEKLSDKFLSLEQELPKSQNWKWIIGGSSLIFLFAFLLLLPLIKRKRRERLLVQREKVEKKKWLDYLKSAKSRSDYEKLYSHRMKWMKDNWIGDTDVLKFFESMHRHQYKKDWPQEIKEEIDATFAKIKGKLNE